MSAVVGNRRAWGHIDGFAPVYAAVLDCGHIGKRGTITWADGTTEALLVVDCANPEHIETIEWMTSNNVIIEVGYRTAARHGFVGAGVIAEVILHDD